MAGGQLTSIVLPQKERIMSIVWIAVLLIVPIIAVVITLNILHKKGQQKINKRTGAYLAQVVEQTGIVSSFQKQLSHQLVILDDANQKLLVVDHVNSTYSHTLYHLDDINSMEVTHVRHIIPSDQKKGKSESFTSQIGLELISGNGMQSKQFLVFYDHVKHSLYLMAEMEGEAKSLGERIREAKTKKLVST